jgi:tetratricopeptide (TPR) repeat protein
MRSVLASLVEHGPTVLALEDMHWADPTSLHLTGELARLTAAGPVLLLVTRRPEPDLGVSELEAELAARPARPLQILQLARIGKSAERSLARSLLGGEVGDDVLEVVCEGVDGNPLFLEERLASLLDAGALDRGEAGWRLGSSDAAPLPEALERLVRSRVDRLSPVAREAIVAASVLGEEAERSAVRAVSELGVQLDDALAELVSAGLLTEAGSQPEPLYRFRHAMIREATYNGLLRSQRRQLHARAAWHLEESATGRLEEMAGVLGRHFAAAGERDRAVHYLEMAGDHAARIFANEEAIASYRQALAVTDGQSAPSEASLVTTERARSLTAAALCEKLADVLLLLDRFDEARAAARAGLAKLQVEDALQAAWLQFLLGTIEFQDSRFDAALAAYDAAQELIGPVGLDNNQECVDLWLLVQLGDKISVYGWRNELERSASLIESARPLVEARGSGEVAAYFFAALADQHLREQSYRVNAQVIAEHRRAAEATWAPATSKFTHAARRRCSWMGNLGLALAWHGDLVEARQVQEQALASAERQGSPGARGRVLVELAVTALRGGDVEGVRALLPQARAALAAGSLRYYVAALTALQAWVAWRDQRVEQALVLGAQALELWEPHPHCYPYCLALWPLAGAHLEAGHVEEAVDAARRLLEPSQARLPGRLEAAVQAACEAWDRAGPELAGRLLGEAVQLASDLGYA